MIDLQLSEIKNFHGTSTYYDITSLVFPYVPSHRIYMTDGIRYVMENGYSWLVTDFLAQAFLSPKIKNNDFLYVKLKLLKGNEAEMQIMDSDENILETQHYSYTDALYEVEMFLVFDGQEYILLLPSEW